MRVSARLCPRALFLFLSGFHKEIFSRPRHGLHRNLRTGAQDGAETALR
jgi:hypothetical protein